MLDKRNPGAYRTAAKQLALLAVPVCAAIVWMLVLESRRPIDVTDIKIATSQLRSLSAEANKLTANALSGEVTESYFDVHARMLFDKSIDARKQLESGRPRSRMASYHRDVAELARELSAATGLLSSSARDRKGLQSLANDLRRIRSAAEALEHSLATLQ